MKRPFKEEYCIKTCGNPEAEIFSVDARSSTRLLKRHYFQVKKIKLIFLILLIQQSVFAQNPAPGYSGVYLTKADFIANHLSYQVNTHAPGCKLEFPPIADWALTIRIVTPESVNKFKAGSVYGYYDNGKVYRFAASGDIYVPEDFYRIEEDKGLVIYSPEFNGGNEYYYSRTLTSPIHRLNMKNLKRDFKSQPEFINAAKSLNKKEVPGDVAKRDNEGHFIVNNIYRQTTKK